MIRFVLRIEPGIDVTLAKAQPPAQIEAGWQGAAVAVAVVEGLYGKSCYCGQVFEGEQAFHVGILSSRNIPAESIGTVAGDLFGG